MIKISYKKGSTNKYLLFAVGLFFLFGFSLLVLPARAADNDTVVATVTVQNIAVSVSDGTIAYGTLGQNSTMSTCGDEKNDAQTVTNDGNVTEDFDIKAIANASTPDWTIGATAGSDVYVHEFQSSACAEVSGFSGTALTVNNQTLATSVAAEGTTTLNLQINTPNPSTSFDAQDVSVIITASAS